MLNYNCIQRVCFVHFLDCAQLCSLSSFTGWNGTEFLSPLCRIRSCPLRRLHGLTTESQKTKEKAEAVDFFPYEAGVLYLFWFPHLIRDLFVNYFRELIRELFHSSYIPYGFLVSLILYIVYSSTHGTHYVHFLKNFIGLFCHSARKSSRRADERCGQTCD